VNLIAAPTPLRARHGMIIVVGPSSLSHHCPSRGHFSKTKQTKHDRPIVTMERYDEVDSAASVAAC